MKRVLKKKQGTKILLAALALALIGGSFAVASGVPIGSQSLLASVVSVFTGKPTVTLSRTSTSPAGVINPGVSQNLATFSVNVYNVKWQGTLRDITVEVPITGGAASILSLDNLAGHYTYCIPKGVTYGYGYKGGSCGTIRLTPQASTRSGNTYRVLFSGTIPIYPRQAYGAFVVSGTPTYTSTNALGLAMFSINVTGATAVGDQCRVVRYGFMNKYGYSKCGNVPATVTFGGAKGNVLTVRNMSANLTPAGRSLLVPSTFKTNPLP